ncbi:hypothetical protein EJ05DRAFT_474675 [Pseudovirgaria hyperparasitica]|uniref:C2H2-type domain-containing protein n=1 Tax=Pseudovirgaria hyperparasitica TaxID=470096 RepID=A0A6A6WA98_9PEZI|nr:uncharacterized protein EJ05DRAFT_474675 [Pseudovirgaria hyperparasitica]KAF2759593.1 hypothetical protein EJ05DRAFT_474675 [Pseudovirgaria hyperparasitica]
MPTDLEQLKEMGFDPERAQLSLKKSGNLTQALEWLEKNQDMSWEQIQESEAAANHGVDEDAPALKPGEEARSLKCSDCGKGFRSTAQAEFHASKSGHENFEESTEEIKPLTEEEKAAKLQELKEKLAAKRVGLTEQEKAEKKQNEMIRRKATKESQDIKEQLQVKERLKEAQAKKKEKQDEIDARKRALAKIEADKQARREKAEAQKAQRAGLAPPEPAAPAAPTKTTAPKSSASYTEARLRLQTSNGTVTKTFPAETTLFEVAHAIAAENGVQASSFTTNFPKKSFELTDFGMTLKEAGMVPSSALVVK